VATNKNKNVMGTLLLYDKSLMIPINKDPDIVPTSYIDTTIDV
jgi:hypothetical protein